MVGRHAAGSDPQTKRQVHTRPSWPLQSGYVGSPSHRTAPMLDVRAEVGAVDAESRTVELIFSTGAPVLRFDWWTGSGTSRSSMKPEHIRLDRLSRRAPIEHPSELPPEDQIGVVEEGSATVSGGKATARGALFRTCGCRAHPAGREGQGHPECLGRLPRAQVRRGDRQRMAASTRTAVDGEPCGSAWCRCLPTPARRRVAPTTRSGTRA